MKTNLNRETLKQMPEQVRAIVQEWKNRYNKRFISVENTDGFFASEDAHVTMINLLTGDNATAQASGDFSGFTPLSPTARIPLPVGMVAVEEGFFCGVPFLTVFQGSNKQLAN